MPNITLCLACEPFFDELAAPVPAADDDETLRLVHEYEEEVQGLMRDRELWLAALETYPGTASHMMLTLNERMRELTQRMRELKQRMEEPRHQPPSQGNTPEPSASEEEQEAEESEESASAQNDDDDLWSSVYSVQRQGNRIYLQTYGGGPSGGYVLDYDVDNEEGGALSIWDQRGWGSDRTIAPMYNQAPRSNPTLWIIQRPDNEPSLAARLFHNGEVPARDDAELALQHFWDHLGSFTDENPSQRGDSDDDHFAVPDELMHEDDHRPGVLTNAQLIAELCNQDHTEDRFATTCPICIQDYQHGDKLIVPRCGHRLHKDCYANMVEHNDHVCPQCRGTIVRTMSEEFLPPVEPPVEPPIEPPVTRHARRRRRAGP
jgi:hypothetical protein